MHNVIPVTIRDRIATKTGDEEYICGNSDFTILFEFDAEWDAWPTKTARFTWAGNYYDVLFEGSECPVPVISDVFHFKVGVYAGNLRTTTAARVPAKKSVLCGGGIKHEPPETDVYNEILEKVNGRVTQEQMEQAIDQAMDAEFFIIHVDNNVSDKSDEEIRAAADEGKVCVAAVKPFGWLFTYVGDRPSSDGSGVYCPTFTLVWYKEYGKMTALDLEVHGNAVKVRGRDNVNLPNPYKLTLTGAVNAEYDGSEQVTVKIPTIAGPAGKDGYTPQKGVDYFDGKDGYTPQKGIDYFDGKDGPIGPAGADGFNPEVRLERTEDGVKITAVNQDGEESQTVYDGKDGEDTEFFIVRIGSNNVSNHTEEEIQAAVGEGKICIAIGYTGDIYTYVGRMRKTDSESGYAATFYMPMKHAGVKADVNWIQISGNQAYHYLRNDARLANPWKLTLTGAVEAEYDGSKQTTVNIPTIAGPAGKDGYTPQKGIDYFDGKDGKDGTTGPAGADGYSPTITLTRITGGVRIDAQNKSGTQTATVYDGKDGEGGGTGGGGLPTGGDPNMMLVTDADGNAQWQERTHYIEEVEAELYPETTVTGEEGQFVVAEPYAFYPTVGGTYTVTFVSGETTISFNCVATEFDLEGLPTVALGNIGALTGSDDTGEPFVLFFIQEDVASGAGMYALIMFLSGADTEITFSVSGMVESVHMIDEKYIPKFGASSLANGSGVGSVRNFFGYAEDETYQMGDYAFSWRGRATGETSLAWSGTASGDGSVSFGEEASGAGSFAANGSYATGFQSFAANNGKASGNQSFAEGFSAEAKGDRSHAEGYRTIASSGSQHVQGKFNIEDTEDKYAHIVGNGANNNARSNAHTLDWDGNAWFAGTVEGTALILKSSTSGSTKRFKITVDDSGAIKATAL